MLKIRPGTREDVLAFDGEEPKKAMKVIVGEEDGKIIGYGALVYQRGAVTGVIARLSPEARRHKVALHRVALMLMKMAREARLPNLVAIADPNEETAERWLMRLGFRHVGQDSLGKVYLWQRHSPS